MPGKKKNVFITGVSGYLGQKLVAHLSGKKEVGAIIGTDIAAPPETFDKLEFIEHDIREDLYPVLEGRKIDWAIHGAYVVAPTNRFWSGLQLSVSIGPRVTRLPTLSAPCFRLRSIIPTCSQSSAATRGATAAMTKTASMASRHMRPGIRR